MCAGKLGRNHDSSSKPILLGLTKEKILLILAKREKENSNDNNHKNNVNCRLRTRLVLGRRRCQPRAIPFLTYNKRSRKRRLTNFPVYSRDCCNACKTILLFATFSGWWAEGGGEGIMKASTTNQGGIIKILDILWGNQVNAIATLRHAYVKCACT